MQGQNRQEMSVPEAYRALGFYVVEMAVKDYKRALNTGNKWMIKTLERFFRSEWCFFLSDGKVDGEKIITEVRRQWKVEKMLRRS